ncbi:MAG: hypothetical protein NC548_63870 [Lachnospiraceae bacterium]|nr:hypothetical protein [Lachnospiraceae bacterium]
MDNTKENVFHNWVQGNIYNYKKLDGILYAVFYIIFPVTITAWSLYAFPSDFAAGVYCYLTILIGALNCLYDAINRWQDEKSIINVKLLIMIMSISIVAIYCLVVILGMLLTSNVGKRIDGLFFVYFIVIIMALFDLGCCFVSDLTMRKYTNID